MLTKTTERPATETGRRLLAESTARNLGMEFLGKVEHGNLLYVREIAKAHGKHPSEVVNRMIEVCLNMGAIVVNSKVILGDAAPAQAVVS